MKVKWIRLMATALLMLFWQSAAVAQVDGYKIAVVTDPHVLSPDLLLEDGTAWQNELAGDRKLIDFSQRIFDHLVDKFAAEKPDLLLLPGDLTKDGELLSHQYVIAGLDKLRSEGIKVLVIPGNHDIDNTSAKSFNGASSKNVENISSSKFAALYADYGYGGTTRDENSLSYVCEPIDGLALIGIDSHTGTLSDATLSWVCEQAEKAWKEGKQVIAMMHHPLFPHILGADMFVSSSTVANYETVRNSLADAGVRVILTGHFHTSDIAKDWNADLTKEIYDVNTGSVISYPCDYRIMTLSEDLRTLNIATESVTTLDGVKDFSDSAKVRLTQSMTEIAKKKLDNETLAEMAANVFITHAEGNEHESEESETYITTFQLAKVFDPFTGNKIEKKLTAMGLTWNSFESILKSILEDKSNYGDASRENQTDDRTLTITMPDITEHLTLAADGWSTYCSDRSLDLTKTSSISGFIVESVSATSVKLKAVNVVPENTGFIVNGTGGSEVGLYATADEADDVSSNLLTGILTVTSAPENAYVLSSLNNQTGFYRVKSGLELPAHKAYLLIPSGSSVRQLVMPSGQVTGIGEVMQRPTTARESLHTLQGVRVDKASKGIYIKNGKLIIVK